jgi:DNA-binding NarL/FixJ family response regulator
MLPRALLADDHPAVLNKVASLLASTCEVVGKVADGSALLEAAARLQPDILVIDISMPVLSGIEAARQLKTSGARAKIVFLTVHEDPDFVQAALAAGACGYVIKSRLATDLLRAVEEALAGRRYISPSLSLKGTIPSS